MTVHYFTGSAPDAVNVRRSEQNMREERENRSVRKFVRLIPDPIMRRLVALRERIWETLK